MGSGSILSALVESEIAALRQLPALISQSDVERAARAIMKARRIYVFGRNHATALMQLMTLRLTRSGYAARRMDRYGMEIADDLMDLSAKDIRSEEHTSELQSLMRISYAVFCLKKKNSNN